MFESPDPELDTALELAKSNPEQAAQVLRIAARYLYKQEKLPAALAYYLAEAFELAMKKASIVRGSELLINLNLKAMNRRAILNFEHVGIEYDQLIATNVTREMAIERLAAAYKVSDRTIERSIAKYRDYQASEASNLVPEHSHYAQRLPIGK